MLKTCAPPNASIHLSFFTSAALPKTADSDALSAKYMADFAPFLLSPQMMQKIETAQHNYASEMLESVKEQHAQVACGVCVCSLPSLSLCNI